MGWAPRYTEAEVREAATNARSIADALRHLGLRAAGGNHRSFKRWAAHYGVSLEHFDPQWAKRRGPRETAIPLAEVLVRDSTYHRGHLKRRLYEQGLKSRRCEMCGQGEIWRGAQIGLILDHINGDATDHRLANLRILCPNCNATLEPHCGRRGRIDREPRACLYCGSDFQPKYPEQKYCSQECGVHSVGPRAPQPERRKVPRPSHAQLLTDLTTMSVCAVGRKYGVSDNAVRKWLRWYDAAEREAA
jgi:hypothetical protein